MVECHYKKENIQRKLQKKILITKSWSSEKEGLLSGSAKRQRCLCLRINLFGLGLGLLCLICSFLGLSSILSLRGGLGLLTLAFVFGHLSPLALITNLAGSFRSLREGESSLSSQRLP